MKNAGKEGRRRAVDAVPSRLAALAIGTTLLSAHPVQANSRPAQREEKPPETAAAVPLASAAFPEGTVTVAPGTPSSEFTNFTMLYDTKDGRASSFVFSGPPDAGEVLAVLPGRERAVVVTESSIIITLGYKAAARGQRNLNMEGRELDGNTYYYSLPEDVRGTEELPDGRVVPKLLSATMVEDQDGRGATLFFIGRNGGLRATRVERFSEPYAVANIQVNEDARLLNAGSVAILAEPGRNVMLALAADFESHMIVREPIALPAAAEGRPEIRGNGRDIILSFNNMSLLVLVGEPGNPHSVAIATVEQ